MNKTIPTTISGILFYVEENAYKKLSEYLESLRRHFTNLPEKDEVIADIEGRIAEHFLQTGSEKEKIVTEEMVEKLIESMGKISDFDAPESTTSGQGAKTTKRLFRNSDDIVIGGVASGLAAYFGIDPIWMRVLFIISLFANGIGIVIYIALWIAMPEAKSSSEKLQMQGEPITVESLHEQVKEKVASTHASGWGAKLFAPIKFIAQAIAKIIKVIVPLLVRIVGFFITIAAIIALVSLVASLLSILFNMRSPFVDEPFLQLFQSFGPIMLYVSALIALFVAGIPLLFIFLLGLILLRLKRATSSRMAWVLLGVWLVAVASGAAITPRWIERWDAIEANGQVGNTMISRTYDLADFKAIDARITLHATITKGEAYQVALSGRERDLNDAEIKTENGALVIENKDDRKFCILCFWNRDRIEATIQLPELTSLELRNGSEAKVAGFTNDIFQAELSNSSDLDWRGEAKTLSFSLHNGSHADVQGTTEKFTAELFNSSSLIVPNISASTTNLTLRNGSETDITGTTNSLSADLANSSELQALSFTASTTNLTLRNGSEARVNASTQLIVDEANSSDVRYVGTPAIQSKLRNGSRLLRVNEGLEPAEPIEPIEPIEPE